MSRYVLESAEEGIHVVVGFDRPLRSLFAQVFDTRADDDEESALLSADFGSVGELARAIAGWAELPFDIRNQLAVESGERSAPPFERPERVVFGGQRCLIVQGTYRDGSGSLQLVSDDSLREPIATPTASIPEAGLAAGQALVREYAENEGVLDVLVAAGVVRPTGRYVASGYVRLPVVELLPAARHKENEND